MIELYDFKNIETFFLSLRLCVLCEKKGLKLFDYSGTIEQRRVGKPFYRHSREHGNPYGYEKILCLHSG